MSNISSMTGYANAKVQTDMGLLSTEIQRDHLRQNRPRQDGMPLEFSGFRLIGGYSLK